MTHENFHSAVQGEKPTFKERRFHWGVAVSVIWILCMAALLVWHRAKLSDLEVNQWGDFFAGAFAPLAFLWLVLGYLQQGEELRMSTMALHLQAEELQKSAEQQRQLVDVTRQQLESEREAREFERIQRDMELSPIIEVEGRGGTIRGDGASTYNIQITNTGYMALAFKARVKGVDGNSVLVLNQNLLERGASVTAHYELDQPLTGDASVLHLTYRDAARTWRTKTFAISRDESNRVSSLEFRPVADSTGKTPPPGEEQ